MKHWQQDELGSIFDIKERGRIPFSSQSINEDYLVDEALLTVL
jgi:hypothetical protein